MDDLKAIQRLQDKTDTKIELSVFLIFTLVYANILSKEDAWKIIEKMKLERDWQNNIIYETAKELWSSL